MYSNRSLSAGVIKGIWDGSVYGNNYGKSTFIITYHQIREPNLYTRVSPENLDAQMSYLNASGFTAVTLDQFFDDNFSLPEKPFIFSVDDATRSFYENAIPILDKYGWGGCWLCLLV